MRDLKIMVRVLILGLFTWLTIAFSKVFIIVFWVLLFIAFVVGVREAKKQSNERIAKAIDDMKIAQAKHEAEMEELKKKSGAPFDEDLYSDNKA